MSASPADRSPGAAWYAVGLFFLLYCISYVDRFVLSLLAEPISKALDLTDTQLGLLIGTGFGVVYALAGVPLAHLIDTSNRLRLVTAGVLIWSVCTIASGFAPNYTALMLLRAGVAIGEAGLSACAISIIADLYPPDKRTLPTAVYTSVGTFMGAGSFLVGGATFELATRLSAGIGIAPWQLTLILVGMPGLVLGPVLFLTVAEPPRLKEAVAESFVTAREALAFVRREAGLWGYLCLGLSLYAIGAYASPVWVPTLLVRGYGLSPADAGYVYGLVGLCSGLAGAVAWPLLTRHRFARGHRHVKINLLCAATFAGSIGLATVGLSRSAPVLYVALAVTVFTTSICGLMPALIVQELAPGRMRARLMAGILTSMTLVGLMAGSVVIPFLAGRFFTGPLALGGGFAMLGLTLAPLSCGAILMARRRYVESMKALVV